MPPRLQVAQQSPEIGDAIGDGLGQMPVRLAAARQWLFHSPTPVASSSSFTPRSSRAAGLTPHQAGSQRTKVFQGQTILIRQAPRAMDRNSSPRRHPGPILPAIHLDVHDRRFAALGGRIHERYSPVLESYACIGSNRAAHEGGRTGPLRSWPSSNSVCRVSITSCAVAPPDSP